MTKDEIYEIAKKRWDSIAKPVDGLGDLEGIICRIASIQGKVIPDISKKALVIMCADNGVVSEGVSQTGKGVTREVAALMGKRRSSVGVMSAGYPLDIFTYDVGIDSDDTPEGVIDRKICRGTADFLKEPAMSSGQCRDAMDTGVEIVRQCSEKGYGLIATGEMGIGNTTTATALLCAFTGADPRRVTGRGAGLSREGLEKKILVIEEGLRMHAVRAVTSAEDAFDVLRCLGGLDIAALTGVFIGGAEYNVPVVIDGLISAVAALAAEKMHPGCRDFMIASHYGREKGMKNALGMLSLRPVIHADMALGEGTGAVMLFPLIDMAFALYSGGTSFDGVPIEKYERFET